MPALRILAKTGLNRSHVAARSGGLVLAVDFSNTLSAYDYAGREFGVPVIVSGQPSIGVAPTGVFGQSLNLGSTSTSIQVGFPNKPVVNPSQITFGCCVSFQTTGYFITNTSSGADGYALRLTGTSPNCSIDFNAIGSAILANGLTTIATNVPYFIGVSGAPGATADFVLCNLLSGVKSISAAVAMSSNVFSNANGVFSLGGKASSSSAQCYIANAAIVYRRMSLVELLKWADDPWGLCRRPIRQRGFQAQAAAATGAPLFTWLGINPAAPILAAWGLKGLEAAKRNAMTARRKFLSLRWG